MEIIKVDIYHIVMKLKVPFETSFGKTINRHGILVKVEDVSGCVGWGETPVEE